MKDSECYWEVALNPGDSTSTTFTAPSDPGEYQVVCSTPDTEAGMVGKLTVVAP
jgi:plastocyanin